MKRVIYSKYQNVVNFDLTVACKLVEIEEAEFLQFGVDYEEFENGPGNFSTALLRLDNGRVISVRADHIRFVEGNKQ